MLINSRKTIGVFTNQIDNYFQMHVYRILREKAFEYNDNILIFQSKINLGSDKSYDHMEEKILDFAPVGKLDGIIVIPDSYGRGRCAKHLEEILSKHFSTPIVYIRRLEGNFYNIGVDEKTAIRSVIRHFIYDHHFTRISFMGGTRGHSDAEDRYQCFIDEMRTANLTIAENGVFHGDFWCTYAKNAAEYFTSDPENIPQAIVCANDYMAVALCDALKEMGYRIPEDICVSGYDNAHIGKDNIPSLTTVSINFPAMTEKAIDVLYNLLNGNPQDKISYIKPSLKLRASCGCGSQRIRTPEQNASLIGQSDTLLKKQIQYNYFSIDMDSCQSMEDMYQLLSSSLVDVEGNQKFYICLFGNEDDKRELEFTDHPVPEGTLVFAFENKQNLYIKKTPFFTEGILPDIVKFDTPDLYYVTMLHNSQKYFGYTVTSFEPNKAFDIFFHSWHITLGITIDEIYSKIRIRNLMEQIEAQSKIDPLTGLYNRRGFEIMVEKHWKETITANGKAVFIGIDLDHLKYVNDNFGHSEGDYSICVIATAINEAVRKTNAVSGRMGGDEFAAVIFMGEESEANLFKQTFDNYIHQANLISGKPYVINASLGYYVTAITDTVRYEDCMSESDKALYEAKRMR